MDPISVGAPHIVVGDIVTMDHDRPRAEALATHGDRIIALGAAEELAAALPGATIEHRSGTIVPGFIDSHFYLQRGGIKVVDLFPGEDPDSATFQRRMSETALEPDWPDGPAPTAEQRREGLRRIQPLLHALGITGVADPWATAEAMTVYQAAHAAGELTMRVTAMPYFETFRDRLMTPDEVIARIGGLGIGSGFGDERLAFGAFKLYVDGEGKRRQALREEPWPGTDSRGIQAIEPEELEAVAAFCAERGWALGVHAIGGAAMRIALDAFERVDARIPLADKRFRLIHAYLEPSRDTMARAARLGILLSSQPAIQWHNASWLLEAIGDDAADSNPLRDWTDAGVRVVLGSDGPYFPFDPLRLMWFVRTRAARGTEGSIGAGQRLGAEEALRGLTADAAFAAFADTRGILAPGMLADWVELDVDPLRCADDALLAARVLRTVIGGRTVFAA